MLAPPPHQFVLTHRYSGTVKADVKLGQGARGGSQRADPLQGLALLLRQPLLDLTAHVLSHPLYLPRLIARLDVKSPNGLATTWELGSQLAPSQPLVLAVLLILMTFVSALVIDRVTPVERRTAVRMALAMALSLVVAPYANAYDGVLLAPLVFVAFGFLERHPIALVLAGIAVVVLSWWLSVGLVADWGSQSATAILPVGTLVGTACIALLTRAVTPRSLRISEGDRVSRLA